MKTARSMRSPVGRARGLGSAHEGLGHWISVRITGIALVPLTLWFVAAVIGHIGADRATIVHWVAHPFNAIALLLLILATFRHMAGGLEEVVIDYVHHEGARLTALLAIRFAAAVLAVAALYAVLKMSFGG